MCGIVWLRLKVVQSRSPIQNRIGENPGQSEALYTSLVYGDFAPAMNWQGFRIESHNAPEQRSCFGEEV